MICLVELDLKQVRPKLHKTTRQIIILVHKYSLKLLINMYKSRTKATNNGFNSNIPQSNGYSSTNGHVHSHAKARRTKVRLHDEQTSQTLAQIDEVLAQAYHVLTANRFQSLLLEACRQLLSNVQKHHQEADLQVLQEELYVLEKWVDNYHAGDQIAATLFVTKALYYSHSDLATTSRYIAKAKQVIEETSRSYFLCKILTIQGDVQFSQDPIKAAEAYKLCISYCQKSSLVQSSQHILEEFKTALIICNYKLALLQRLDSNTNQTILKHLCESARSARDLFGEDSPVFQRFQQYYFEEQGRKRKPKVESIKIEVPDDGQRQLIHDGTFASVQDGHHTPGEITIWYRIESKELEVQFKKQRKGRKQKLQITEKLDIPIGNLTDLGKKLSWIKISNNKITVDQTEIKKVISQEQKQYRTFLRQIGREEMFDKRDIENSSDEEVTPGRSAGPFGSKSSYLKHTSLKS